jgi:protein-L-isoaspartate(D-aspartate) O-methyltransferase
VRAEADRDAPLPIGEGQTVSQPFVIALMVQALALRPGDRVLEIGTGSGYQTAILCELVREPGRSPGETVFSVERFPSLLSAAAAALRDAGYRPHLTVGDGAAGWPDAAPYQGIVVSAAAEAVPQPLYDQLATGGRLLIPVGPPADDQTLWRIVKQPDGMHATRMGPVRFVPLVSPLLDDPATRIDLV